MIKATYRHIKQEVAPRLDEIIFGVEFWLAFASLIAVWLAASQLGLSSLDIEGFMSGVLNYASIAFGFSITGITLSLAIPSQKLVRKMAKTVPNKNKPICNTYSDLLFVFSWTALVHLVLVIATLFSYLIYQGNAVVQLASLCSLRTLYFYFLVWLITYGALQFLITLYTISAVGRVYVSELKKEPDE